MTPQIERKKARRVAFSNRVGDSLAVMKATFERGIELYEAPSRPGDRGTGKPLPQEWE